MSRESRQAHNQELLREVNGRIADMALQRAADGLWLTLVCECSRFRCGMPVEAPLSLYSLVQEHDSTFLVRSGHEDREHEAVIAGHGDYCIVELSGRQPHSERASVPAAAAAQI